MDFLKKYDILLSNIDKKNFNTKPYELYDPIKYFFSLKRKKIRPIMCLLVCDLFSGNLIRAIRPALAIEYFHNFTLIHDDIIDDSNLRRNEKTIHKKYGLNTGILSGDALLIKSYELFDKLPHKIYKKLLILFSKTALEVCEGQQMDINFEKKYKISFREYIKMIGFKTGVLSGFAFKLGGILANTNSYNIKLLYKFGFYLGIAFQIMDDYLDVFGDPNSLGKEQGKDIYKNKKTILYILALKNGLINDRQELKYWYSIKSKEKKKFFCVKKIFKKLKIDEKVINIINKYNKKSINLLKKIELNYNKKKQLIQFTKYLLKIDF